MIAAFSLLAVLASTCAGGTTTAAAPTPIADSEAFSFEELYKAKVASASPSPSPSLVPIGGDDSTGGGSGSSKRRASAPSSGGSGGPTGPVSCPSGTITGELSEFSASKTGTNDDGVTEWRVTAKGIVTNRTSQPVQNIHVDATLHADNADADSDGAFISKWVGTGSTANWTATFDDYAAKKEPKDEDLHFAVTSWSWGDGYSKCPTNGSSS